MKEARIFIDPGHGGDDNGAAWGDKYDYVEEDDLNLALAFLLRCDCMLHGYQTLLSRTEDAHVALGDRSRLANGWGADIFVSLHADAFHNETARGISTHIYTYASARSGVLGHEVHGALMETFPDHVNRGVKRSNFHVLRETRMPAILVEAEFISNPDTRRFLKEPASALAIATAIGKGIDRYFASEEP